MVIVGVLVDDMEEHLLKGLGVKDSKLLLPHQREELFDKIKKITRDFKIIIINNRQVDAAVSSDDTNLNWLEADISAEIINSFKCDVVYLDCPSVNTKDYREYIEKKFAKKPKLIVEHKADAKYSVVAAASILAKVIRDREINKLKKKFKVDFGSGYPSDPFTRNFLANNYNKYPFFRKSWSSWKNAAKKHSQTKLGHF